MSRSALWHQEKNVQRRQQEADEAWEAVIEEGRNNQRNNNSKNNKVLALWGPDDSFRLEPMLLNNIKKSNYFIKICQEIHDWTSLVDEIYYRVDHMEPWAVGGVKTPSTGFCLLLRLLTMRSTINQMTLMLNHVDSPYIRAIGFLYLRYTCEPPHLFSWFQPFLFDEEPIQVRASKKTAISQQGRNGGDGNATTDHTIGSFVRMLLSSRDYCGTTLPRLPIQIERDIQVALLQAEKIQKRADTHFRNKRTMELFQTLGSKVMATYEDEDNPLTWYEAEVDRVILRGEDGELLKRPKFVVTFTEYGNTEIVTLGEMDVIDGPFYKEDMAKGKEKVVDAYEEVRRREQNSVTASGRDYHRRPPTTKDSLAAPTSNRGSSSDRGRHLSSSPSRGGGEGTSRRGYNQSHTNKNTTEKREPNGKPQVAREKVPPPAQLKRTAEETASTREKKRKLLAKYG